MVFLLSRRSGVAPFGLLKKSSVRSALMLLARAAPRCKKSQKNPRRLQRLQSNSEGFCALGPLPAGRDKLALQSAFTFAVFFSVDSSGRGEYWLQSLGSSALLERAWGENGARLVAVPRSKVYMWAFPVRYCFCCDEGINECGRRRVVQNRPHWDLCESVSSCGRPG